ncbi:hypothetical protein RV15_GL000583 [Enterococcus silesiacus]|uniref:Uncharacterized protein n=1 Tax=Enterococcus silesiacus TaxID=332949 RepID=A0AA91GE72_9ENTE|nr:hypothetical protein RV15_GL000583 [Enterococcus silesiacus]
MDPFILLDISVSAYYCFYSRFFLVGIFDKIEKEKFNQK